MANMPDSHNGHSVSSLGPHMAHDLTPTMKSFTLFGKVAVVTGGARGLGHNMAQALAESGARGIAILDVNEELGRISAHLMAGLTNANCRFYKVDVKDEKAIHETINQVVTDFGSIDILVNSAGFADTNIPAESYPADRFRHQIEVNLTGSFLVAKNCAQRMITQKKGGSIILIASMSATVVNFPQDQCAYNASKAGVIQLMKSLAAEWAEYGIRVNAISPGYMNTPLTKQHDLEPLKTVWRERTPMARLGDPGDLNGLAVFLASDASSFMTGSNCIIDGGYTIW